jgi:sec-independent protein translocase protein TatB
MLGLTLEKFIVIGIIAAVLIGPQRLPQYAQKLGQFIQTFRAFAEASKTRAESELGMPLNTADWNSQIQQYDPRRIVRDAWNGAPQNGTHQNGAPQDAATSATGATPDTATHAASADTENTDNTENTEDTAPSAPAEPIPTETHVRWVIVGGSSGHPIRRRIVETVPVTEQAEPLESLPDPTEETRDNDTTAPEREPVLTESAAGHVQAQ